MGTDNRQEASIFSISNLFYLHSTDVLNEFAVRCKVVPVLN